MKRKLKFAKEKKVSISKLKKRAWRLFSEYIRRKDVMKNGNTACFTCGFAYPWKSMQAGHWLPGRHNAVLFDERNVHPQCVKCNIFLKGNLIEYTYHMQEVYSPLVLSELRMKNYGLKQFRTVELESLIDIYKRKLSELE